MFLRPADIGVAQQDIPYDLSVIVPTLNERGNIPLVVAALTACLRGTGEERVDEIFAPIGLKRLSDTEEAVKKAVAIANGRENA